LIKALSSMFEIWVTHLNARAVLQNLIKPLKGGINVENKRTAISVLKR